jgi:hypothetical protein
MPMSDEQPKIDAEPTVPKETAIQPTDDQVTYDLAAAIERFLK